MLKPSQATPRHATRRTRSSSFSFSGFFPFISAHWGLDKGYGLGARTGLGWGVDQGLGARGQRKNRQGGEGSRPLEARGGYALRQSLSYFEKLVSKEDLTGDDAK